ncbi:type IV toxin-antitoxin system AbiEi family antitoxin domain-containing protein [Glaciibacter sp. 2TAF33]|uniref:type IV toxin-antitoxin system AbiEi family antitoxin domain-containing protein n=1 Tax=Glaciibacter sp. 2TAF33 TaxID=3233015 RepID=UPI003F8FAFA9
MHEILETAALQTGGLITTSALRRIGGPSHTAETMIARGELVRVAHGIYVDGGTWRAVSAEERYRLFVRANALLGRRPAVVSHLSAAVLHGLPTIGGWPKTLHTIDNDATGGSNARFTTRHRNVVPPDIVHITGLPVTSLARTLVDVASSSSFLIAVTMIDHALRVELERVAHDGSGTVGAAALTKDDLHTELVAVHPRFGARQAAHAIEFANPLAANPGETMGRVRMFQLGFEVPELQVHFSIKGKDYWVDYFWRRIRKVGEFDGDVKYTRGMVLGDRDPSEIVVSEKRREDILRQHVNSFDRWDWNTALSPRRFYEFLSEHGVPRA